MICAICVGYANCLYLRRTYKSTYAERVVSKLVQFSVLPYPV
ncbi:MAG: hypothetical protein K0S09_2407 [Sphingobacteriaceae bacterium]|nr:hypothetical protein [Sphingobacteriaceae bacterium]